MLNNNNNNNNTTTNTTLIATFRAGEKKLIETQTQRRIGSIADYDPLKHELKTENGNGHNNNILSKQYTYLKNIQQQNGNGNSHSNGNGNGHSNGNGIKVKNSINQFIDINDNYIKQQQIQDFINDIKTTVYKAIYDYDAKEDDEISFRDGDKFINCEQIDIGWMIGNLFFFT